MNSFLNNKHRLKILFLIFSLCIILFPLFSENSIFTPYLHQVRLKFPNLPKPPNFIVETTYYKSMTNKFLDQFVYVKKIINTKGNIHYVKYYNHISIKCLMRQNLSKMKMLYQEKLKTSLEAWVVQLHPEKKKNPIKLMNFLQEKGFNAFMDRNDTLVFIGPELNKQDADEISQTLNTKFHYKTEVKRYQWLSIDTERENK